MIRALDLVNPVDFVAGLAKAKPGTWDKVKKYAPIAIWKDWGYFDADTGKRMKDVLFEETRALDKVNNALIQPAGTMDSLAWSHLWNAIEAETSRKTDLEAGTKEYYEAVAKRFNEVVDHSQVVDGVIQRSQIMRSSSDAARMATSFMSEPTKAYNMFLSAVSGVKSAPTAGEKREAGKHLGRTAFALALSFAANAAAQSIVDALRAGGDDRDEDYWVKFWEAFSGTEANPEEEQTTGEKVRGMVNGNLGTAFNPVNYIPFVKDVYSIVQGYDVSRMDMDAISAVIQSAQTALKALSGDGTRTGFNAVSTLVAEAARLFGIPAANIKRDILAIYNTWANETGNYMGQYFITKLLYRADNKSNHAKFKNILSDACDSGDTQAADELKRKMTADGIDYAGNVMGEDKLKTSVESSSLYKGLSGEGKEKYDDLIHSLAMGSKQDSVYEKTEALEDAGLDASYYILYRIALEKADADGNGSYTKKEARNAIQLLPGVDGFDIEKKNALMKIVTARLLSG